MASWLFNSLVALVCFGLWAFLPKVALRYISPKSAVIYEVLGVFAAGCIFFLMIGKNIDTDMRGILPAMATGVLGTDGFLCFLYALTAGSVSVVATLTALYPAVTILLAVAFLRESITLRQVAGMGLGLGLAGALALSVVLQSLLFEMRAQDPLTFLVVVLFLGLVALAACYLPARRATKVEPMVALRCE